jgi:L-asparaginase
MSAILLIYTGGTIGMMEDAATGALKPFEFEHLLDAVPELRRFNFQIDSVSFDHPIDSSDIDINDWQRIAELIEVNYEHYDGFVVLHGTDTMSYSASALSFMLENLDKPVIFTGSQLPIGRLRTDGKDNLITAIEIAAANRDGISIVQEVCIYFESQLFRGNRTHKYNTENFDAFKSTNFPSLANAGIHIFYSHDLFLQPQGPFRVNKNLDNNVGVLKIFPGISESFMRGILQTPGLKAVVMETYGSGNAPRAAWFIQTLKEAIDRGMIILNVSQCNKGFVEQGRYETSSELSKIGVIAGADMTVESAVVKLMFLLGQNLQGADLRNSVALPLRGELTDYSVLY